MNRRTISRSYKAAMTVVSLALTLYFVLSLTRDFAAGSETWPIYVPGVVAGVVMTALIQRTKTQESDDSGQGQGRNDFKRRALTSNLIRFVWSHFLAGKLTKAALLASSELPDDSVSGLHPASSRVTARCVRIITAAPVGMPAE
ncbi:hypothetical protein QFZ79_003960 [Arthrobacter sp. V4I6]|uniref:hypothetical protein n=1 Tax=unclassified Arthrobacter TaxID=235627 RepID=UPI002782A44F|nr:MULTISPECIES: hypothetical protein [unclassified Arthrobacter]MDQ0821584.1 hypothetical protein [Arthrobacter sp. V1I7]MDQ0855849.1 hypothetical protein [Arthrobacter sp. V4I6]